MHSSEERAIAIVGVGAILPDALSATAFWDNILNKKYSISEVPPERWSIEDYYDPDPSAPDKTYSKIGGWVRGFEYDWRRFRMPPKVAAAMDQGQQWAVTIAAEALQDYGYPERPLDTDNTAVILGTAMGGELHYITHQRIAFPEFANALSGVEEFSRLPEDVRDAILSQWRERIGETFPQITEDSMPGELPNIVSGRVANLFNLRGPNFITDAACASSFAALKSAVELLNEHDVDAVLTGGVDHNMGISSFVKFCKIGALSASGSRPFGEGADGFVMGEGSGAFLLKRLEDAERSGDKIYAVIRGIGGSSDGKGKGITAPNPIGQELAVRRAWQNAGLDPATATLIEAHGTSTRVGDVVEVESLAKIFDGAATNSIGLGSAKSNIGHLKAGAGAAGLLKAAMALHHKILPPTLNAERPNPNIDFAQTPFRILHEAEEWPKQNGTPRRCGVSAYGFGGTNFHIVLEEHIPGYLTAKKTSVPVAKPVSQETQATKSPPKPVRGILAIGANSPAELQEKLDAVTARIDGGWTPPRELPRAVDIQAPERLVIDFGDHEELAERIAKASKVMSFDNPQAWEAMEAQGIFRGSGRSPGKIAFMFPGQGSQYVNMGCELSALSPVVAGVFAEADEVMAPILGKPLTEYIFVDPEDSEAMMQAQFDLLQTEITQPAMLAMDTAMMKLLAEYGFEPDMVVGHSLGEYAALIAAEALPFSDALEAVAARGSEMSKVSWDDNGRMAAVLAPYDVVMEILEKADGYVVPANINSYSQCVIGGASEAVEQVSAAFEEQGYRAIQIPVSHAFHTEIVAPASEPLRQVLDRLGFREAKLPIVANVTGEFYPQKVEEIKDMLQVQVASPVQWVKGLETLYDAGIRTFVEVGPKRALRGFARDVLKGKENIRALLTNHPKTGELPAFNQALCGLYAAGYLGNLPAESAAAPAEPVPANQDLRDNGTQANEDRAATETLPSMEVLSEMINEAVRDAVGRAAISSSPTQAVYDRNRPPLGSVVISGTGLGLPGAEKDVMDPDNAMRILHGEQFVDLIPERFRNRMVKKRITRVVKAEDGSGSLQTINDPADVIKLAGRPGRFDLEAEYGVSRKLIEALDITSQVAIAAGLDALREAGIPLVQTYRETTTGKFLPDRWLLPESLRDDTGVIFASAFPGGDRFAQEFRRYYEWQNRVDQLAALEDLRRYASDAAMLDELNRRISMLREEMEADPYTFDRRFLFRILSMGHSQFAQYIGARGPNTQVNAACASTAQSIALAEDWIRNGRCRRVVVIGGDVVTSDELMDWVGAGFLAVGAATTKDRVDEAALPFDARRHGTIMGMGACGLVVESEDALRERGMRGIVEVLSSETSNSAFHGTRLDIDHISMVMEHLVSSAERRFGLNRYAMAPTMVFMSHETYTPARGGSAAAEILALRRTFGQSAGDIIIANTKGFTGHPMGVGVEDVIAVKILEQGIVPPVPNIQEVDPDLGTLNLSRGGRYPVQYALHLAAGFGSQISMTLTRRIPGGLERIDNRGHHERWLADISGDANVQTEIEKRVLRIVDRGKPENMPAASTWQYGTGPTQRAVEAAESRTPPPTRQLITPEIRPAPEQVSIKQAFRETAETAEPMVEKTKEPAATLEEPQAAKKETDTADPLVERIIGLVAEQTGYPPDMLDLDLDLEADLGIDTVKQAETFLAIREMFDIPQQEALSLRDYNTLEKVIGFVKEMRPDLASASDEPTFVQEETPPAAASPAVPDEPQPETTGDPVADQVLALVAEQTGYPVDMLELDLDLEADLGIDTVKQAETFLAIREMFDIPQQQELSLRDYNTLAKVIGFVKEMRQDLGAAPDTAKVKTSAEESTPKEEPSATTAEPDAGDDVIVGQVLSLVAEQTGYPEDMLEIDLDLEADLGIDTVKQAETFLAIREMFDIPQQQELSLRDYNTLEKVIGFVKEMRPDLVQTADAPPARQRKEGGGAEPQTAENGLELTTYHLADADLLPRRVPTPSLRPDLDLCKETGVILGDASRIVIMPDEGGVAESLESRLHKLGAEPLLLNPAATTDETMRQIKSWLEQGKIQGVYWLPALDVEPDLDIMTLDEWHDHNELRVKKFYATMRALYDSISTPGTFLVAATRLGGLHGYGSEGASAPLGGGVTGFAKAFHIEQRLRGERRGPLVKCVDFAISRKTAALADTLLSETVADPGVVEVGIYEGRRYGITLQEEPAVDGQRGVTLNAGTVFLVTGAAGGITSEIVADLAFNSQGTFYLLDLAEAPDENDPDVQLLRNDKEGLKQQLIEQARAKGERPTPVAIEKKMAQIERSEAALKSIESVEAAGGTAHYHALNLLDAAAVAALVDEIRERHGRIDVLIHAAGLLIDRTLPDKEPQQFDLVYNVKADGFFNILKAAQGMPLGASIVFSSVAGRFGNNGQSDYSAANDLLCKITSSMRRRPGTKAIAIDWTAWGDIGMAARGSVPTVMKALGIDMLPPASGVPTVRRELAAGGFSGELLVAGELGAMVDDIDATGGLDLTKANEWLAETNGDLLMTGKITGAPLYGGLQIETTLHPAEQPFLFDHAPDEETPWLPGVMAIEGMAEAAILIAPGFHVASVNNVEMSGAFKFFHNEPRTLYLNVFTEPGQDGTLAARVTLRSITAPAREGFPMRSQVHFRAGVVLASQISAMPDVEFTPPEKVKMPATAEQIYENFFHGPAYQVIERAGVSGSQAASRMAEQLPPNSEPADARMLMAPRLVELCFQTAAQWSAETKEAMAFPLGVGSLSAYLQENDAGAARLFALISTEDDGQTFDAQVVDENGRVFVNLRGYRTVSRPGLP